MQRTHQKITAQEPAELAQLLLFLPLLVIVGALVAHLAPDYSAVL
ncbi:hypothetical protein [Bartonella clarridgeiae]|nr:hypothetical protein [Bartonella clarridgeiae]WCR55922.1 MAG: hypothetical protein PG977_001315 [Bartonella clarridgeiae]